jgi:predicted nucleic acid-binding protein
MELVEATSDNVVRVSPSFQFHIVTADPDDNKFTDCAIASGADYLVSDDHHFDPLLSSGHKTKLIRPAEFITVLVGH